MTDDKKPESIENRWDILYRDYPEVYHRFASGATREPDTTTIVNDMFKLHNKAVLDIGSGTGQSTLGLARYAKSVIGIEPNSAMLMTAQEGMKGRDTGNIIFIQGKAQNIPLKADSVDMAIFVTSLPIYHPEIAKMEENAKEVINEASRVIRTGGFIISVDIAPFWYGGELAPVILGRNRRTPEDVIGKLPHILIEELYFEYKDFFQTQKYKSMQDILQTYGFIYGKKAIQYLIKHQKTTVKWKFRIYYKRKGEVYKSS